MTDFTLEDHIFMTIHITCLGAPLQIEGQISKYKFYYRERHGKWRLEIQGYDYDEVTTLRRDSENDESIPGAIALITHNILQVIASP